MPVATPGAVRKQIQSGNTDPLYLLLGEDDVEKSALAAEFAEIVDEGLRAFNVERIHAGDMTCGDRLADGVAGLVSAVRTMPMMVPRRVVTVTQAEILLVPKRESEAATRALDQLEALLKQPEPQTTLVFVAGAPGDRQAQPDVQAPDRSTRRSSKCGTIEDLADAERWVRNRIAAAGAEIEPAAARRLAERAGADVKRLRGEVDRLLLYAMGQPRITLDDVREVAGPAALQDDWAMTNAIEAGAGGRRAEAARPDARVGSAAGKDSGTTGLAGQDEVSRDGAGGAAGRRPGVVPDRPRPQAVGGRSARPARKARRRVVRR